MEMSQSQSNSPFINPAAATRHALSDRLSACNDRFASDLMYYTDCEAETGEQGRERGRFLSLGELKKEASLPENMARNVDSSRLQEDKARLVKWADRLQIQLQCGVAVSVPRYAHFGEGTGLLRTDIFECTGNESSLLDCRLFQGTQQECSHRNDASVICSGKYGPRLVDGMNRCSGRVEVLHGDQWWTLCDLYFDMEDANVVCEHLQCGAVNSIPRGAHFGKGTGPVWKENYRCRGNETRLWDCPVSSWEQFSCSHENDASVICTDENWSLRLTNGASHCDGRVEIYYTGSWGRLQDRHWTLNDANVVCTQLGCGEATASYNYSKDGKSEGPVWVNDVQCEGNELQLQNCSLFTLTSSLTDSMDVGVLCAGEQILHRFYKNIKVKCLICSEKS
ncbi:scavenger receptor cysteine-rich type 1 protein M130-like [Heterodontus francisci]|uniref:scavenger receptor cysteine-rich type 1 protein M130-like n=1 Tax=Heterodontus francisci TaxID=7792 RepID=UPI00355C0C4B